MISLVTKIVRNSLLKLARVGERTEGAIRLMILKKEGWAPVETRDRNDPDWDEEINRQCEIMLQNVVEISVRSLQVNK